MENIGIYAVFKSIGKSEITLGKININKRGRPLKMLSTIETKKH